VPQRRANTERLGSLSDAVFAVIITIMVLELKLPPDHATFGALLPLWPTALSYLVSYYFIAIWLNHHHLLKFCQDASPRLIWINFVHMFMVSLVPYATAWIADTKLAAVPVFAYAAVFVLVNLAYVPFEWHALASAPVEDSSPDAAIHKNALGIQVGHLRSCDAGFTEVSFTGLWVDLLRFAGLPATRACGSPR
jgi:uncharacterized membrane protein